jgi:hypothetical protein
MQACADRNNGSYTNCALATIQVDEPSLSDTKAAVLAATGQSVTGYTLTSSVVATGDVFSLVENNGVETRTCTAAAAAPAKGRCDSGGW